MYVPKVVIIGGGFAGLAAAEALKNSPVKVVVIDRQNHHTFSPLLYQAASSLLSPTDIGAPLRHLLRKNLNTTVILGEVSGIDTAARSVMIDTCERLAQQLQYDYLIVASGVETSYAGHDDFESHAPGLKSLHDAAIIRNKILNAFEQAEIEEDPAVSNEWLTFVLVGGGPTGVEMEGTIAAMVRLSLEGEFRRIDPNRTRIIVVDGGRRLLAGYSPQISAQVKARLESQRVEVHLGEEVDGIDACGVTVAGKRIGTRTIIWTAGVRASTLTKFLGAETDKAGRLQVNPDLTIRDHPELMAVGDIATLSQDGKRLPGVAQVAMQQGRYAGKLIHSRVLGKKMPEPFRYFDKGNLAVVGRNYAVFERDQLHLTGFVAWIIWATVHLLYLGRTNLRITVLLQWVWAYVTGQRSSRLIVEPRTK